MKSSKKIFKGKIANYTSNNGMYIKRDNVRIKGIILDLRDVILIVTFYVHSVLTSVISNFSYL